MSYSKNDEETIKLMVNYLISSGGELLYYNSNIIVSH